MLYESAEVGTIPHQETVNEILQTGLPKCRVIAERQPQYMGSSVVGEPQFSFGLHKKIYIDMKEEKIWRQQFGTIKRYLNGLKNSDAPTEEDREQAIKCFSLILNSHFRGIIPDGPTPSWYWKAGKVTFGTTSERHSYFFAGRNRKAYQLLELALPVLGNPGVNELIRRLSVDSQPFEPERLLQISAIFGRKGTLEPDVAGLVKPAVSALEEKMPTYEEVNKTLPGKIKRKLINPLRDLIARSATI